MQKKQKKLLKRYQIKLETHKNVSKPKEVLIKWPWSLVGRAITKLQEYSLIIRDKATKLNRT